MLGEQRFELSDNSGRCPGGQQRFDPVLLRLHPQVLEPGGGGVQRTLVGQAGERGSAASGW